MEQVNEWKNGSSRLMRYQPIPNRAKPNQSSDTKSWTGFDSSTHPVAASCQSIIFLYAPFRSIAILGRHLTMNASVCTSEKTIKTSVYLFALHDKAVKKKQFHWFLFRLLCAELFLSDHREPISLSTDSIPFSTSCAQNTWRGVNRMMFLAFPFLHYCSGHPTDSVLNLDPSKSARPTQKAWH